MNLIDIVQLVLLSAVIFFTLGYLAHRVIPHWLQYWKNRLLSPRYLKPARVWMRSASSTKTVSIQPTSAETKK
ncbi:MULTISPECIES: cellulose biosynthesis protein BcsF [Pectobacterium]|uniref:Lipoprotein n=2 Tax=Pectobacterium TaxID=122277 RepID=A0ABD6VM04_9GAMM|nr:MULTISPECIES: cellulose biosynthesis protein BcsF [Pectobacterium]QQG30598.1 cellulose biosynthesis protein BcsF [Pectobacterium carotovorum]AIU90229.1 lipoprotein [Pectobacterium odoriferum]KGA36698.1 lipoprotein [Pectobacterium odoriferum]KGA42339.1 lipoprotein [Pectobacterium odoriferum]MBA0190340.1 cellulose biosynthesis protein BcsF [Pectobacterium odoriferum]